MKKIKSLEEIKKIWDAEVFEYGQYSFEIERIDNDVNGNPRYKIRIWETGGENCTTLFKKRIGRVYSKKGFGILQSYNITESLKNIFR